MESVWMWIATSFTSPADLSAAEIGAAAAMLGFGIAMLALLPATRRLAVATEAAEHYDKAA